MEVKFMKLLKPVTPREARAVWSSIPNPSVRRVAQALSQAGRKVHPSTIARWHAAGWRPVAYAQHPLEAASDSLDVAAAVLTGDPPAGAAILERLAEGRGQLEGLTDGELLRQTARELCINIILVSRELQRHVSNLVAGKTMATSGHSTARSARRPRRLCWGGQASIRSARNGWPGKPEPVNTAGEEGNVMSQYPVAEFILIEGPGWNDAEFYGKWLLAAAEAQRLWTEAAEADREGIVSKRLTAPYRSGPSRDWIKVKNPDSPATRRAREGWWWGHQVSSCLRGATRHRMISASQGTMSIGVNAFAVLRDLSVEPSSPPAPEPLAETATPLGFELHPHRRHGRPGSTRKRLRRRAAGRRAGVRRG
jgi:hypothetical protein